MKTKDKKKSKKSNKVDQPNKLARLILQRMVEGRASKCVDQPEKNTMEVLYTLQPDDMTFFPGLMYEVGQELKATISAEVRPANKS